MSQTSSLWEITIHTLLLFDYENYEDKSGSRDDGENEDESYSNITTAGEEDTDAGTVNSNDDEDKSENNEDSNESEDDDFSKKYDLWKHVEQVALGNSHISKKCKCVIEALSINDL